jgi:hypothetical protein
MLVLLRPAHKQFSGTIYRLSFVDVPLEEEEKAAPKLCLALRVLYQYLSIFKVMDQSYTKFCTSMKTLLPLLSLEDVLEFIRQKKGVEEQLVTIQIDETQVDLIVSSFNTFQDLINVKSKEDGFLYQLLKELWKVINDPHSKSYCFVILSGTNALQVYKEFLTSNYKCHPINLPLLESVHLLEIIKSNIFLFVMTVFRHNGEGD